MKCPELESIILFAMQPPAEKDAELAAHVYSCGECREKFILAMDAVHCEYEITSEDLDYASGLRLKKSHETGILADIVKFLSGELEKQPMLTLSSLQIPHLQEPCLRTFASSGKRRLHREKPLPEIPFFSVNSRLSQYYWSAVFQLPLLLHKASNIQVRVRDGKELPIAQGVLNLGGVLIKVQNGEADLSLDDFKKSAGNGEISFEFPDKYISPGVIGLQ